MPRSVRGDDSEPLEPLELENLRHPSVGFTKCQVYRFGSFVTSLEKNTSVRDDI